MRIFFFSAFLLCLTATASHDGLKRKGAADIKVPDGLVLAPDPGPPPPEGRDIPETKDRLAHWEKRFDKLKADYAALVAAKNEVELKKLRIDTAFLRPFKTDALDCYRWASDRTTFNPDAVEGWLNIGPGRLGIGLEHGYPTIHDTDRQRDVHGNVIEVPIAAGADGSNLFSGTLREERRANLIPKRDVVIEAYKSERGDLVIKFHQKTATSEMKIYCVGHVAGSVEVQIARRYENAILDRWAKTQTVGGGGRKLLTERVFPALRHLANGTETEKVKAGEYLSALLGSEEGAVVFRALHEYGQSDEPQELAPLERKFKEKVADLLQPFSPDWKAFSGFVYEQLVNAPWLMARAKLLDDMAAQMRKDEKELAKLIADGGNVNGYHHRMLKAAGFELVEFNHGETLHKVKKDGIVMTIRLDNDSIEIVKDQISNVHMEVDLSEVLGKTALKGKPVVDPHLRRLMASRFPSGEAIFKTRLSGFMLRNALNKNSKVTASINDFHYYNDLKVFLGDHFAASWVDIVEQVPAKKTDTHELLEGR